MNDALPQGLLGHGGHGAVPPVAGSWFVEAAVRCRRRRRPLVQLHTFT